MTRMKSGAVALIAAGLGFACSNPTSDLQTGPKRVLATPQFAVIDSGGTAIVLVQAFDAQGYAVPGTITFTADPTLGVAVDPNFRKSATLKYGQQYIVTGNAADTGQVIFSVGSISDTVTVFTKPPATLAGATVDITTPTLGQLVTVTVPTGGYIFTAASASDTAISVAGGAKIASPVVSADGSQISFVVGPDAAGPITIKFVQPTFATPLLPLVSVSTQAITTAARGPVALSTVAPGLGVPVVATVPAGGYTFTSASVVTVGTNPVPVVALSADSTQLSFVVGPGANDSVVIDGVIVEVAPLLGTYALGSTGPLTTASLGEVTLSAANPALGVPVVVTVPTGGYVFTSASTVTVPGTGTAVVGLSADSTQLSFLPGPNANGPATVDNIIIEIAPVLGTFSMTSPTTLTTQVVTSIPSAYSTTTPNVNDLVTVTAPGFLFLPSASIRFGNVFQTVTSVAANGSSFTFRAAQAGGSGTITIGGTALTALPSVPLELPSAAANEITVGATITALPGTDAVATAPTVEIAAPGFSAALNDVGAFNASTECGDSPGGADCRIYKVVLTEDAVLDVSATWNSTADLGIYFFDAALNDEFPGFGCDAHGNGATAHPESCSVPLSAGTHYIGVTTFAAFYGPPDNVNPTSITLTIDTE